MGIVTPSAYQMFKWCLCVGYVCIILVSLQLHKGMHDLDSKKKSKTEKTKVNVRKALCPVGIFCKLGLWEYWKQWLICRKSGQIVEQGDSPGCRKHKDMRSRLENGRMEQKKKHRQTINLICMSTEFERKRALTPAKYPPLCTVTADFWSEAKPHCYNTKATWGGVASYIQTDAFLSGSFGRVPQNVLFHIVWVQVVFTTLSFLWRKNHCEHKGGAYLTPNFHTQARQKFVWRHFFLWRPRRRSSPPTL